jgi:hypothetical protein
MVYLSAYIYVNSIVTPSTQPLEIPGLPYGYGLYGWVPAFADGGFSVHIAGNIIADSGPGYFSAVVNRDRVSIQLRENIVGKPSNFVNSNRVRPFTEIYLTGFYFLALGVQ